MTAPLATTTHYLRPIDASALAGNFRVFAEADCVAEPLYAALSRAIANDADILGLLMRAPYRQRRPVLLFAAVHDLLLAGVAHPLAAFYRSVTFQPAIEKDVAQAFPVFRNFCATHRDALAEQIASRTTQTNETGRTAGLALALAGLDSSQPVALIDIGCSAGLNLLVDRFRFEYQTSSGVSHHIGCADAKVAIVCRLEGSRLPPPALYAAVPPKIAGRIGLDLAPLNVSRDIDARWLRACVWPSETVRKERLDNAIDEAKRASLTLVAGDADAKLDGVLETLPASLRPVLFHSWALSYFDQAARLRFAKQMRELVAERDAVWISAESAGVVPGLAAPLPPDGASAARREATLWHLTTRDTHGVPQTRPLARSHPHCAWIEWLDERA